MVYLDTHGPRLIHMRLQYLVQIVPSQIHQNSSLRELAPRDPPKASAALGISE